MNKVKADEIGRENEMREGAGENSLAAAWRGGGVIVSFVETDHQPL